jgi:hypothetical protein
MAEMPAIEGLGSLQKALLSALDQMGAAVSSVLEANQDMVFLHQSPGIPIDPKEFENPWTPDGGDVYALMAAGGDIKIPAVQNPPAPAAGASTPPSSKPQPLPPPDPGAEAAVNSAVNTAHLANQNLQIGTPIASYGLGTVADAWGQIALGTFADPPPPLPQSQVDAIKKATDVLYLRPGVPTEGYRDYRKARDAVIGLVGAKAAAFVAAMGDPSAADAWPLGEGKVFDEQIQDAETDRNAVDLSAGDMSFSDAEAFINAQGKDIVTAAAAGTAPSLGWAGLQAVGLVANVLPRSRRRTTRPCRKLVSPSREPHPCDPRRANRRTRGHCAGRSSCGRGRARPEAACRPRSAPCPPPISPISLAPPILPVPPVPPTPPTLSGLTGARCRTAPSARRVAAHCRP